MTKVYELVNGKDNYALTLNIHYALKYHKLEKSCFDYFWATIIGTNRRIYGFFKEVDVDLKTALKINNLIHESEKTIVWY